MQTISRKDQSNGGKIEGASAPEGLASVPAGILRDYMPDSNEKFVGKDIVRTAWRHAESGRNVHSSAHQTIDATRNTLERNSLSGKFRPARMA